MNSTTGIVLRFSNRWHSHLMVAVLGFFLVTASLAVAMHTHGDNAGAHPECVLCLKKGQGNDAIVSTLFEPSGKSTQLTFVHFKPSLGRMPIASANARAPPFSS